MRWQHTAARERGLRAVGSQGHLSNVLAGPSAVHRGGQRGRSGPGYSHNKVETKMPQPANPRSNQTRSIPSTTTRNECLRKELKKNMDLHVNFQTSLTRTLGRPCCQPGVLRKGVSERGEHPEGHRAEDLGGAGGEISSHSGVGRPRTAPSLRRVHPPPPVSAHL